MSNITKKQHYVTQFHLKNWQKGGNIFCYRQKESKLFSTNTNAIANETYFYRSERLTDQDVEYIKNLIGKAAAPELRDLHVNTMNMFQQTFLFRDKLSNIALSKQDRQVIEKMLVDCEKTLGEKFHAFIEGRTIKILHELRICECNFYLDNEHAIDFIYFISNQFFRTPILRQVGSKFENPII